MLSPSVTSVRFLLNPLMLTAAKSCLKNSNLSCRQKQSREISTTLRQFACETIRNFEAIVKSFIDPDDKIHEQVFSINGLMMEGQGSEVSGSSGETMCH